MSLRLGFHYHIPARLQDGRIVMPGYQGCFVDGLAAYCEKIICFLHSPGSRDSFYGDYDLHSTNVELVDIGPHTSVPHRILFAPCFTRPLIARRDDLDVLLLRGASPLLPAFARAAGELPVALLLVSDYLAGVDDLPQPLWRKELIRFWAYRNNRRQLAVARRSLTFVNSHKLFSQLQPHVPRLVETRTTTLSEADFFYRDDTCQGPPYHLLYTGRMDRTKGLLEMVEALALLVEQGHDCILDLVGMLEKGDPILPELQRQAASLGITDRVIYHGYKPLGSQLSEYYRKADIFLIASQASEGFPRTIWEAMAHCLPVVASKVGSIPDYIEGAAELIEPKNVDALKNGILKILVDSTYRKQIIRKGYALALDNKLERRSKEMFEELNKYIASERV